MNVSIILPTCNEAATLDHTLDAVFALRPAAEVIVSDGNSRDGTARIAHRRGARVVRGSAGRGAQMHRGACAARGDVLWFLPPDTVPPRQAVGTIMAACADEKVVGGNFQTIFDGPSAGARLLTWLYPKLVVLHLRYGDSGIFVRRGVYMKTGGFRPLPIFEDLDLMRRVRRHGLLTTLGGPLITQPRRFESKPFAPEFARWAGLQILYWLGCDPMKLGRYCYSHRPQPEPVRTAARINLAPPCERPQLAAVARSSQTGS